MATPSDILPHAKHVSSNMARLAASVEGMSVRRSSSDGAWSSRPSSGSSDSGAVEQVEVVDDDRDAGGDGATRARASRSRSWTVTGTQAEKAPPSSCEHVKVTDS